MTDRDTGEFYFFAHAASANSFPYPCDLRLSTIRRM
jgi:hypothetical protein